MNNTEFDKRVRQLMEGHQEVPDVNSWNLLSSSLDRRRRLRALYMRRAIISTAAVAASLVLLLLVNRDFTEEPRLPGTDIAETPSQPSVEKWQPSEVTVESKPVGRVEKSVTRQRVTSGTERPVLAEKQAEKATVISEPGESIALAEPVKEIQLKDDKEVAPPAEKRQTIEEYLYEERARERSGRRSRTPLIAMATNFSPSTASNSVTLLAMSQSGSSFQMNDVVSTVQKAFVPQEVISNTKFLMPVSVGVQFQYPLSKILSVGSGLNYTMLFSNYDDLSREETRQTQQTLHYIGIPVIVYGNLYQNENLRLYISSGITAEKGLYAHYKIFENGTKRSHGQSIDGVQWSLSAGMGAEFFVNSKTGLYFDPSFAYYFDNNQPLSIRSSQPLQFKFELGMRFHL